MSYFSHRGIDFHYQVFGLGEPIIFLHGIGNDLYQPKIHQMHLPGHLIMPDLRAHGKSGHNNDPMSYGLLAEDLYLFVKYLGLKNFILGGIDIGAGVALNFTLKHPEMVKKLILVRPSALAMPCDPYIRQIYERLAMFLKLHHGVEQFKRSDDYNELFEISPYASYHLLRHFTDPVAQHFPDKFQQMIDDKPIDHEEDLKKIGCPTLTVVTDGDMVHPVHLGDILNEYINNHTLVKITPKPMDERKHLLELETAITDFLNPLK